VASLLVAGARIVVVAPTLHPDLSARLSHPDLTWEAREVDLPGLDELLGASPAGPPGWRLVVAATDRPDLNAAIAETADRRGIWTNDVTDGGGGPLAVPAVHRRGPVTLAVATGGLSPGAAAWLRDALAEAIDPAVVGALELLAEVLAEQGAATGAGTAVTGHTEGATGRLDWRWLVDSGMLEDIRHGRRARAKERLQACLS
jgi:precorrin-2 dehydrogenase/sirohydrochlorin ferrochelatase